AGRRPGWRKPSAAAARGTRSSRVGERAAAGGGAASVALARVELAQPRQDVELLQQRLRHGGEVGLAAHAVEVRHQLAARALHRVVAVLAEDAVGLEVLEVPDELFTVEVGQRTPFVGVHATSRGSLLTIKIAQG